MRPNHGRQRVNDPKNQTQIESGEGRAKWGWCLAALLLLVASSLSPSRPALAAVLSEAPPQKAGPGSPGPANTAGDVAACGLVNQAEGAGKGLEPASTNAPPKTGFPTTSLVKSGSDQGSAVWSSMATTTVTLGPILLLESQGATINTSSVPGIATLAPFGALVPAPSSDFPADLALIPGDPVNVYQLTSSGAVSRYHPSGVNTPVSTVAPPAGQKWSDMATDPVSGSVFASSTNCGTSSKLSIVDLTGGTSTLVGTITNSTCLIGLAADNLGNLYGYDILSDKLLSISQATGQGTIIGSIGFDANYGQSMDCDRSSGFCYMFAFSQTTNRSELRRVNLSTGATTFLGVIGSSSPGGSRQIPGAVFGTIGICSTDAQCPDGSQCNGTETCINNACTPGTPVNCDDGEFCTIDTCAPQTGECSHVPNPCNDNEPCTHDTCYPWGCESVMGNCCSDEQCYDWTLCNGLETCTNAYCEYGTPLNCDDGIPCTFDTCYDFAGCFSTPGPASEVMGFGFCSGDKNCLQWATNDCGTTHRVYVGSKTTLPGLLDGTADSCILGDFTGASTGSFGLAPPAAGALQWFLATAVNESGEGSAGTASTGPRHVDPNGNCRSPLVINEVDYDNVGVDTTEFVEIYNPNSIPQPLAGLVLVLNNGAFEGGMEYLRVDLSLAGPVIQPGQSLVVADNAATVNPSALVIRFTAPDNNIQNGSADGLCLFDTATNSVIDALSYEGSIIAATIFGAPGTYNLVEGSPTPASDSNTAQGCLARIPNGVDTNNAQSDWAFSSTPTPGAANAP